MAYGQGEYGQRGYGGVSFEEGAPQLTSSSPFSGEGSVDPSAVLILQIDSTAGLDPNTLYVTVEGVQFIAGGVFLAGSTGTLALNPETSLTVTVATHPPFGGGSNLVEVAIIDLSGDPLSTSFSFTSDTSVAVGETLSISESLVLSFQDLFGVPLPLIEQLSVTHSFAISLSENYSFLESLRTGAFQIETEGGYLVRVISAFDLHFDQIREDSRYFLSSNSRSATPGAPLNVLKVIPGYTTYQTGATGAVVPEPDGNSYKLDTGTSTHFRFYGQVDVTLHLGDFIHIQTGQNTGVYQIRTIVESGYPAATVALDKPLSLMDDNNGIVNVQSLTIEDRLEGLLPADLELTAIESEGSFQYRYTFQVTHPLVTEDSPLSKVYRIVSLSREGSTETVLNPPASTPPAEGSFVDAYEWDPLTLEIVDYRTFRVRDLNLPPLRGSDLANIVDRFSIVIGTLSEVQWAHTSGVQQVEFQTTKLTNEGDYLFQIDDLFLKLPKISFTTPIIEFKALDVPAPRVDSASVDEEGQVIVEFDEAMAPNSANLYNTGDYTITGPTTVRIKSVRGLDDRSVVLQTTGFSEGDYTLAVSTSTPKDIAGNPLDPTFNSAIFTATVPLNARSLFTDRGPIAKPLLTLQTGTAATLSSPDIVTLPGAVLTSSDIGMRVRLTGSASNDSIYKVLSVLDTDQARVQARFILPDANSGAIDWELFDPRNGMIADDPSDVTVRVNGLEVTPEAVIGLLGQIVLSSIPLENDAVEVDYSWCCRPRVEVRRLNSKEFRFNAWNRNVGTPTSTGHSYRYNNVLVTPGDYDPDSLAAPLEQPLLRDLSYRAYERAYTAVFNDPTKLLFNSPIHKIAFPPASRTLEETSVFYEGLTLPEADPTNPWERKGAGSAVVAAGNLTLVDNSTGVFPTGQPLFWTQSLDLSFSNVFSAAWRCSIDTVTTTEGVWTGIAAGYSDQNICYVVGYLDDGGTRKIGLLKRGAEDNLEALSSWSGGLDSLGNPTGAPVDFDWAILHSYRIFTDQSGVLRLFVDGDVVETLRFTPAEAPFLEELNAPFDEVQGAFFGSLSRPAESVSTWDFYRYLIQPLNALQVAPSSFVAYEANGIPEVDPSPWTPVGFHGTATILSADFLLLDSTSATDTATSTAAGLVGGDFRGYLKLEPLLTAASQFTIDVQVQLLTHTHGIDPDGLMVAVDDGTRLIQLAFLANMAAPKLSYGGRSLPTEFSPFIWSELGSQVATMVGRYLNIADSDNADGKVFFIEDTEPAASDTRTVSSTNDYILESRFRVESYTVDGSGFAGAFAQVFDGTRSVGFMIVEVAGVRYVALQSDGTSLTSFAFEWDDGTFHTYRIRKDTAGNLVSLFVDGSLLGTLAYSSFLAPGPSTTGQISFGSSTVASAQALSNVNWAYCNAWRVWTTSQKRYVGLWKGVDSDSLIGYHTPLKTAGKNASVVGNVLTDPLADFITVGVAIGDTLVVDFGANKGVYEVANVTGPTTLTLTAAWPSQPTVLDYRVLRETDWSVSHKYRISRDSTGSVVVLLDTDTTPIIAVNYNSIDLPASGVGVIDVLSSGIAAIAFGSFSVDNLAQSLWDFVRYGVTRHASELRIVPPHQILNQWNVMESPERLFTAIPHDLTDFKSSSTGITPQTDPDFLQLDTVTAFTRLNQGTPLVPLTQTYEVRAPYPTQSFVSAFNQPEDVLNNDGDFTLNDGAVRFELNVPDDVLYSCIKVIESEEGVIDVLAPFDDMNCGPQFGPTYYQEEVCLSYTADTLPEDDATSPTPWTLNSDDPGEVSASVFGGILTYGTSATGTRTAYLNNTPLPDAPSLQSEASFRLRLDQDTTLGTGDSQVRFGLSAPGFTVAFAFVTLPSGDRFVEVRDLNNDALLGRATVDYLDGNYHTYRIVRIPTSGVLEIYIDS